jgi:hypothetical protein
MMDNIEVQQFSDHRLDLVDPGIAEFDYFVTFCADQVIMLFVAIRFLILSQIPPELMLTHKVTFH